MALFQDEKITQEQFDKEHNLKKNDIFSQYGYDDILKNREQVREQRINDEKLWVQNIVSPDKVESWKKLGPMTAIQTFCKKNKQELLPYMGTWKQGTKSLKIKGISDKLQTGQSITPEERKQFEDFVLDLAEVQTRGYSFGGGTVNIGLETIPFMAEFALGLLTTGGTASFGAATSKLSTEFMKKGLTQQIAEGVGKTVYNSTINPKTLAFSATRLPQQVRSRYGDALLSDSLAITPEGQAVLKEAETNPAIAFMKALALTNIEVGSELSGEILVRPVLSAVGKLGKCVASPLARKLPKGFADKFIALSEEITKLPFFKAVDTLGFNGILEEMGEERVGDLLKFAFNLDDKEGYSFEQLLDVMFPTPTELAQEALSFGVTGLGMNLVHHGISQIPKLGDKYSKDRFLLDAGIFRASGYDSYIDSKVRDELKEMKKSDEEIDNALNFSSRDDKIQFLKDRKSDFYSKHEYDAIDVKLSDSLKEERKQKLIENGMSESNADFSASIENDMLNRISQKTGIDIDEIYAKEAPTIHTNNYELSVDENGNRYIENEISQEDLDYYQDLAEREEYNQVETAGVETSDEVSDAINEWQEKGTDSKYFKKWFGDSKVVDENGKPLVVYHGSPNATFDEFRNNSHFTKNKDYAEIYKNQGASSLGYKKTADNPNVYEVYLSIKNPFDTRDKKARDIFLNEYQAYYSPDLTDKGMVDWLEVEDLTEWLKENYPEYDGIFADEGGVGGYGDDVLDRGISYIPFNPEQIKSVDNRGTFDESNPNIYYQSAKVGENNAKSKEKYLNSKQSALKNFYDIHRNFTEKEPEQYNGKKTIKNVLEYLGSKDNKKAEIKTPIENITITRNDVKHLLEDNEKQRSNNINKIVKTLKNPNLVITINSQESKKNYYLKTFNSKDKKTAHLQVIKCCKDGNFYVTNFHLKNGKLNQLLKNGQIIYDLSDKSAVQNAPDNNIINDNSKKFNPTIYKQEIQPSLFEGNNKAREIHKVKGSFMPTEKIIELFKNADISTIIHEYAHWYLSVMERYASVSAEVEEDLNEVRKFVKNSGEEFTQEQHEKFARGFEAYIRSGNARSNKLKKIYEDLKNALLQIYDEITKIIYTENGIDKPFTEEDLPQIKGLFDRLLTTENERIQRTVFDKVDEIDEQIKKIKENQAKEEQELDELYKGNIAAINRKSDKQRKVSEYLELAEKATRKVPKAMREFEKRYRDVTLSILAMASGKSKRWVADRRNWSKLYDILENVSDEIVSNGANPEWSEFYALQGVTYETEDLGADYKLAMQAYNTLIADNYSYSSYFNDPTVDKDIEDFYSQLNYIVEKVKTLKGEEKEVAFDALAELTNRIPQMPDDMMLEIAQIIESTFEKKEQQQKEDFNRKSYPNIPVAQQLQMYVTRKLSNLKVYDADKRYATRLDRSHNLYKSIKNATSVNKTKKIIRKINNYVIEDLRNKQRRILHKEIQKQVKINSKLVKTGSVQKGKFDWRTNTVFAELADLNKLSREDAEKLYLTLIKADDALLGEERENWSDNIVESMNIDKTDFQQLLKVKFLEYRSQYISKLDVLHTRSVLEDIMALKFEGRRAKSEEDLKKKLNKYDYENNLIDILQKHKDNKIAKTLAKWIMHSQTLSNWESLLNGIFDANTAEKYSLQQMEVSTDVYAREHFLNFLKRASEIYGFKKAGFKEKALDFDNIQPLADLFRKYDNELYDYKETTFNKETGKYVETQRKLSKSQIMTIFTWSLNEELEQRLYTQFGLEQISDMFSRLSDEDMQLCFALIDCCDSMYEDTNEVFIRTLGISLPKVENYFPSKTERVGSDLDLFHDFMMKSSNPSFIKQRKSCNRIKMDPQNPLEILLPHINKTAKYVVMSEQLNFYNKIFASADVKAKIRDVFGEKDGDKLHRALLNQLAASTFSTYARGSAMTSDLLEYFNVSTNYITSAIGGSGKVTIGQLLSVINYAENMPSGEWIKGFVKACANPVKTYKYMMDNCKYLQSRLAGNSQNEILQTLTSLQDPFRKLKNFCTLNVRWGDIIAITIGGKPYVDYLISTGMTKEEAFDKFVDDTLRAQQAGLNSTTSEWQKNTAKGFLGRMFFAFRNTDIQYERKFIDSIIKASKGDTTKKQLVKTIMIYKVLNPVMFTSFLQNMSLIYLFNALFGFSDGGDDKEKAVGKTVMDIIMALGVAGTNAYGMGGFCVNAIIQAIYAGINRLIFDDSDYKIFKSSVPILSTFENMANDLFAKGEVGFDDVIDAFCDIGDLTTGAPVKKAKNMALGVGDVARGEFGIGFSRMLGWGEYVSTKAWTGKAPKKKKKKHKLDY